MWTVTLPVHAQDDFESTLDEAVDRHDTQLGDGGLSEFDNNLRDYLVRKAKEIMADAPIVATHLVAQISGHANNGNTVFQPGTGVSPGFTISVSAAADYPQPLPVQQQEQTSQVPAVPNTPIVPGPAAQPPDVAAASAAGVPAVPSPANPSVPETAPVDPTPVEDDEAQEEAGEPTTEVPSAAPAADAAAPSDAGSLTPAGTHVPAGGVTAEDAAQHLSPTDGPGINTNTPPDPGTSPSTPPQTAPPAA